MGKTGKTRTKYEEIFGRKADANTWKPTFIQLLWV